MDRTSSKILFFGLIISRPEKMESQRKYKEKLIQKVLRGEATEDEIRKLNFWYERQETEELIIRDDKGRSKEKVRQELFSSIGSRISPVHFQQNHQSLSRLKMAIAAGVSLLIGLGLWLYLGQLPGSQSDPSSLLSFSRIENGVGMKKRIRLPDGSEVHLFHNTVLEINRNFSENRLVKLEGTAFFEISPDPERPFSVETRTLTTEVLGTSFVIQTMDEGWEKISVRSGKVSVSGHSQQKFLLEKNQQLLFESGDGKVRTISETDAVFAWIDGTVVFDRNTMLEMIRVLENWYGIKISHNYTPEINCKISGSYKDLSLEDLLEAIQYSIPLTYTIYDKNVNIQFQNCQ